MERGPDSRSFFIVAMAVLCLSSSAVVEAASSSKSVKIRNNHQNPGYTQEEIAKEAPSLSEETEFINKAGLAGHALTFSLSLHIYLSISI